MTDYWTEKVVDKPRQIIVCAANLNTSTQVLLTGARHWDKIMRGQHTAIYGKGVKTSPALWKQGFIDQFGEFLTREEAYAVVLANGQAFDQDRNGCSKKLYSEGLY